MHTQRFPFARSALSLLAFLAILSAGAISACSREGSRGEEGGRDAVVADADTPGGVVADPDAPGEVAADPEAWEGDFAAAVRPLRTRGGTEEDWQVLRAKLGKAWEEGWQTLPMGESMVRIGLSFLGTAYVAGTLEVAGEEGVVVNLLELDCLTFVENVLAIARFIRLAEPEILDSEDRTREMYRGLLEEIRYRGGRVDGYPSRLHYFSDWIADNEARGLVREVTRDLGGEADSAALDFMSAHPQAYRQLSNPPTLAAIREAEARLSAAPRFKIPREEVPVRSAGIGNGDIIAVTSAVRGLDVAHTGLAYWQGGELHLLHAPTVGEVVEVSGLPLAERIRRVGGQDGIRVVRPMAPGERR